MIQISVNVMMDIIQMTIFVQFVSLHVSLVAGKKLSIFIAVSTRESFGVSILEAAACGIPAITSDVGGLPEVNKHNETGLVIPPNQPEELAEKIINLYKNNELRKKLGHQARQRVKSDFSWDKSVSQMLKIYDKLCP